MSLKDVANSRLVNQHIVDCQYSTAKDIVAWMGAMQAQDYLMAKWAIGLRLADSTDQQIENAVDSGEIIRTHVMRPTWHFVSAEDVYWMLDLSASQIWASLKSRHKQLELSPTLITKCNDLIEKTLEKRRNLTRQELLQVLTQARIRTNDNRLSHILLCAELDGIVCSGEIKNNRQTYALLAVRVPHKKNRTRDESLAELARRYFTSHGPASLADFIWWSGLPAALARHALESVKSNINSEIINSRTYWFTDFSSNFQSNKKSLYLLPAYDEFLIGYKNRGAALSATNNKKAVSTNGIFYPIIVIEGLVQGTWKRTILKEKVLIQANLFQSPARATKNRLEKNTVVLGRFLNKEAEIKYH
jgi:hypothetical protein